MACNGYSCTCDGPCYGYSTSTKYRVQIDATGTPDTFKWSKDGGNTWSATGVVITGGWQTLNNGVQISFDSTTGHALSDYWDFWAGDGVWAGERLIYYYKNYGGNDLIYHSLHPGTAGQTVDSALQAEVPEWNEVMPYTAYSYFRLTYDANAWQGIPDFTALLKGKKLYDPRNGMTAFSRNPALVWLDFLTSVRYGLGVPISTVNLQSVMSAANWCDANNYFFDGAIMDRQAFIDNFEELMMNFRAFTVYSEGIYYLKIFTYDAPVMALTASDIEISPESFTINKAGIPDTPNAAKVTFTDASNNYTAQYTQAQDLTQIGYDADPRVKEVLLKGTTSLAQAASLAKYCLLRNEFNTEYVLVAHPRCYVLEPGDMITVTHEFPNWNNKLVRVKEVTYPASGMITLTLMDEDSSIYA